MRDLTDHLTHYANFHRDRRNIATHFVGIPMIVLGTAALLARPLFDVAGVTLAPVYALAAFAIGFYFRLDLRFALVMAAQMAAATVFGVWAGAQSTTTWLVCGVGLFFVGWAIQFIGHYYEGKKPAFVDDLIGLLVGPLFLTAEAAFALGLRKTLSQAIIDRAGPTRINDKRRPTQLAA